MLQALKNFWGWLFVVVNSQLKPWLESILIGALLEAAIAVSQLIQDGQLPDWKSLWWAAATAALNYVTSRLRKDMADNLYERLEQEKKYNAGNQPASDS